MRLPAAVAFALLSSFATGCVKEISSEERLDRATSDSSASACKSPEELRKLSCESTGDALERARDLNRPETDRMQGYIDLYRSLRQRTAAFEQAMACNPDLAYRDDTKALVGAQDGCVRTLADVQVEFETYVRELVTVPTAQDIKGGNTVTVARLDFNTLRQAIQVLAPDDAEQLLARVDGAEKRLSPGGAESSSGRRR
ncbi:hypothetical protein FGE12_00670 [Aggregicoccus sp. 17bor-14]|uniref:hypothetical protein n=1 Tax=Myxococcaceae TaxID=31 RepID=UPI00129C9134|nr:MULTISPECIES: hypothetical protein [Myxococcaceae]MBF5040885.1 hypothetical protein [Simulacricoccus sp. 17bor-14]MRI86674.1 hypothetical protein [Aggregicoccus sp. 17bor-14]